MNHAEIRIRIPREDLEEWHRWLSKNGQKQSDVIRRFIRQCIYGVGEKHER